MPDSLPPIFDGHNDALLRMRMDDISFLDRNDGPDSGCVFDLPRCLDGGILGGIFAVYITAPGMSGRGLTGMQTAKMVLAAFSGGADEPPAPDLDYSLGQAMALTADLFRLERASQGRIKVARTAGEIEAAMQAGSLAVVLSFEGAEALDPDLDGLEVFHRAGLRAIGIVHSRANAFGHGVPYGFGRSPDTGPGLTDAGKALVRACNRLRIAVDLSHLNERGFWEVAKLSNAPLVASHSCSHAICPATRNLTDDQLRAIGKSNGIVGLNFHVGFLRPDGELNVDTPLSVLVDHIDRIVELAGIDCAGFGSDYDYIAAPRDLATPSGMPKLVAALEERGYHGENLEKILYRNWIRVLRDTWGE